MRPFHFAALWIPTRSPWEIALRAGVIYVFVQVVFRIAGRKELGRWGLPEVALLFLVTTSLRTSIVADDVSLTSGMIGLATIVVLDRVATTIAARSPRAADRMEGPVRQLVRRGELQPDVMRRARVSRHELEARARQQGHATLDGLQEAYLERSGQISLIWGKRSD